MIVGHSRPEKISWTVTGTGASIDTSDTTDLTDGRPDTVVPFTWLSGTQNTSSVMGVVAEWTGAIVPGIVGISNIDLPAGTKMQVAFRRESDAVGTYPYNGSGLVVSQRVQEGPRGERTAWFLFTGTTPVVGCKILIYNDVNGSATIVASQSFHIGEIVIAATDDICVGLTASIDQIDPSVNQFSWNNQAYTSPGVPYRQLNFNLRTADETLWFDSYEPMLAKIDRGQVCAYVLSYRDSLGNLSTKKLHRYALIGIAVKQPTRTHVVRGLYSSAQFQVVESPIPT